MIPSSKPNRCAATKAMVAGMMMKNSTMKKF